MPGSQPVGWVQGGTIIDFLAYLVESKDRTANMVRLIMGVDVAVIAVAAILLRLAPGLADLAHVGLTAGGVACAALGFGLSRLFRQYRERRSGKHPSHDDSHTG